MFFFRILKCKKCKMLFSPKLKDGTALGCLKLGQCCLRPEWGYLMLCFGVRYYEFDRTVVYESL